MQSNYRWEGIDLITSPELSSSLKLTASAMRITLRSVDPWITISGDNENWMWANLKQTDTKIFGNYKIAFVNK